MENIQVKSQIENNDKKVDAIYRLQEAKEFFIDGKFIENKGEGELYVSKDTYYMNLDFISSFRFNKLNSDIKICVVEDEEEDKRIVLEKGTNFITFYTFSENSEIVCSVLAFPHLGEFQRFQRILTDKLCIK